MYAHILLAALATFGKFWINLHVVSEIIFWINELLICMENLCVNTKYYLLTNQLLHFVINCSIQYGNFINLYYCKKNYSNEKIYIITKQILLSNYITHPVFLSFFLIFLPLKWKKKVIENTYAFKICCFMLKVEKMNVIIK